MRPALASVLTLALTCSLALVALAPRGARAQSHPAYFDDFAYAHVGMPQDGPDAGSLLGANAWLVGGAREAMRSWRLTLADEAYTQRPAETYFGGPASLHLLGRGDARRLRLTMDAGFPHEPDRYTPPPLLQTGQFFAPSGTFAARVRFSALEPGQSLSSAFWVYGLDQFRFCPPDQPRCNPRETPAGMTQYWSEMDFEFNNWFVGADVTNLFAGGGTYRRFGGPGPVEGARASPLDCVPSPGADLLTRCRTGEDASAFADRWLLLVFRFDPAPLTREGGRTYRGRLAFLAESDDPGRPGALTATGPGVRTPYEIWRSEGRDDDRDGRFEVEPVGSFLHDPIAFVFSIIYGGRHGDVACPPDARGRAVTCRPHTLDVDWVYHTPAVLTPSQIRREVTMWRSRGEPRVNTLGVGPTSADPPIVPAGADPARIELTLDGPATTAREASWHVRPRTPRGIIYGMEVEAETRCAPGVATCRPRTIRPYAPYFTLVPAPGETGMTVRAKLTDPWWGYTHAPSPGSAWREWDVRFSAP